MRRISMLLIIGIMLVGCGLQNSVTNPQQEKINTVMEAADIAYKAEHFEEAKTLYTEVLTIEPTYENALLNRARTRVALHQVVEARVDLLASASIQQEKSAAYDEVNGLIYQQEKKVEEAIVAYSSALKKEETAERLTSRGHLYYSIHKNTEAKADLQQAIMSEGGQTVGNYYTLAEIAIYEGKYPEAQKQLEELLKKNPKSGKAQAMSAYIMVKQIKKTDSENTKREIVEKADNQLQAALKESPADAVVYNYQGLYYYVLENLMAAEETFTQAITLDATQAPFYNNRALTKYYQGENEGAYTDVSTAIGLDKLEPEYYLGRGFISITQENRNSAIGDFNKAVELDEKMLERIPEEFRTEIKTGEIPE
ncbi:hypothetical protein AwErysi_00910 [Erysipelotrichaceae bacterium]|nr:hypothetical protein AwErysi_00910 [Erysipelotrichaceae bacterium]